MTMKEIDPLTSESKEIYELNDSAMDTSLPAFEAKGRDEIWPHKVMDDFSSDNENGTIDSPRKEDEDDGLSHHGSDWKKDAYLLSSQTYDKDRELRSPEHGSLVKVEELTHCDGNESQDSSSPCNFASDLSETNANLFTDKNVLEYELPELEVFYKEIDYHIVKDICVDEGRPEEDRNSTESSKDDISGHLFPQAPNDNNHSQATKVPSMENTNGLGANQCLSKEENDGRLVAQGRLQSSSDSSFDEDTAKDCDPAKEPVQTSETNCDTTSKAAPDNSDKNSLMDKELPSQEFGARSSLRSFLYSLDGGGDIVTQPPDQILDGKAVSQNPALSSAEAAGVPEEDVHASSLLNNGEVESRSISFNFNSPAPPTPVPAGMTDEVTEDVNADKLSDAGRVHCSSSSIENLHEQSLITKDGNSGDSSLTSRDRSDESDHAEHKSTSSKNDDEEDDEPNVSKNEQRDSAAANVLSVVSQFQYEEGETSFSAVTYSGPIAYSGSLSLRSDGSTTSGRSFAFPILQSEWNSSPVRMAKADRRHFRKHKGWRSGILCCKF